MNRLIKKALRKAMSSRVAEVLPGETKAVLKAYGNEPVYPWMLQVEPTRRCNLRCVMCALTQFYHKDKTQDMTLEDFKRIVSQMPKSLKTINIQGTGEPLLNKELIEMIEFARAQGFRSCFNTNLLLLTDEMAERLVAAGHDEITVSIETTNPERYGDIRRNGTIEKFVENLGKLNRAKERAGSESPVVSACVILMKHTLGDIPELVATMKKYGLKNMHFADLCTYPEYDGPLTLSDGTDLREQSLSATMPEEEVWKVVADIKALAGDGMTITVPGDWGGLKVERPRTGTVLTCAELWRIPFVKPNGEIATCCWAPQFVMGDFKKQTFNEIWFGEAYRKMRLSHLTNHHPEQCLKCQQRMMTVATPSWLTGRSATRGRWNDCFL